MTVSVIIAVYNAEKYLKETLNSLLFQIRKPDEIICVNDGSTDGSAKVLAAYAEKYPWIHVYTVSNGGSAAARCFGFSKSTGEAVCFVDSDDTVDPDYISSLHDALIENEADVAVGGYVREDEAGKLLSMEMMAKRADISPEDPSAVWINTALWNKMIRRHCIPEVSLTRIRQGDDLAYWCRILPNVKRITFVPKPMYHYIQREGSLMAVFHEASFKLFKEEFFSAAKAAKEQGAFDTVTAVYFISLCVSQLPRWYALDKVAAKAENIALLARMDKELPGWRKAAAFSIGGAWQTRWKGIALYICGKLFMHRHYALYESGMCFLQQKLHWKAKW